MEFKKFTKEELDQYHYTVLREIGREIGVKAPASYNRKEQLIQRILDIQNGKIKPVAPTKRGAPPKNRPDLSKLPLFEENDEYVLEQNREVIVVKDSLITVEGILEILKDGYGFLRAHGYENSVDDVHVNSQVIRKFNLKKGDLVKATATRRNDAGAPSVVEVLEINRRSPEEMRERVDFDHLTPCYPDEKINLSKDSGDLSLRVIDLFAPLGKGQRGLIVAPPKTGKTTLLKKIAKAIENNCPLAKLMILLIDERPEEVTDIKRAVDAEVISSTFDEGADHHVRTAELVINRAKRLVELGSDVIILLDSITRLTRAYNYQVEPSGKTLSGGLDPTAMQGPKRFFGSARNVENGGSLTILSTALIETESRMDDVIFEEFKGTGNMEVHLSRELAEKRVFPAIDILKSGTRKDELLLAEDQLVGVAKLRRMLYNDKDATATLIDLMQKTKSNSDLIDKLDTWISLINK